MRFAVLSILSLGIALGPPAWGDDLDSQKTRPLVRPDMLRPSGVSDGLSVNKSDLGSDHRFGLMRPWADTPGLHIEEEPQDLCYKLRTYIVERDDKYSDSTQVVGYLECQPASRYSLRKVAPVSPLK
jgi:hypothetical protein